MEPTAAEAAADELPRTFAGQARGRSKISGRGGGGSRVELKRAERAAKWRKAKRQREQNKARWRKSRRKSRRKSDVVGMR